MSRAGFVLVEVSLTYIVLALIVAALLPMFIIGLRANKSIEKIQKATGLSTEMLEEVRLRKWDQNSTVPAAYVSVPSSTLGPDPGETPANKTTFNDIDDFNGWTENGVQDPMGNPLSAFSTYTRTVVVRYVDSNLNPSAVPTDFKQVTACAATSGIKPVCLNMAFTNH